MNYELDLSGDNCPLPLLKTKKFLSQLDVGAVLTILTTDPSSTQDLKDFCNKTGHIMLKQWQSNNKLYHKIQKQNLIRK